MNPVLVAVLMLIAVVILITAWVVSVALTIHRHRTGGTR